jgi:hypothetical protein
MRPSASAIRDSDRRRARAFAAAYNVTNKTAAAAAAITRTAVVTYSSSLPLDAL